MKETKNIWPIGNFYVCVRVCVYVRVKNKINNLLGWAREAGN